MICVLNSRSGCVLFNLQLQRFGPRFGHVPERGTCVLRFDASKTFIAEADFEDLGPLTPQKPRTNVTKSIFPSKSLPENGVEKSKGMSKRRILGKFCADFSHV